jgi:hypothetical protein
MLAEDLEAPAAVDRRAVGRESEDVQVLVVKAGEQRPSAGLHDLGVGRIAVKACVERDHLGAVDPHVDPTAVDVAVAQQGAHVGDTRRGTQRLERCT